MAWSDAARAAALAVRRMHHMRKHYQRNMLLNWDGFGGLAPLRPKTSSTPAKRKEYAQKIRLMRAGKLKQDDRTVDAAARSTAARNIFRLKGVK